MVWHLCLTVVGRVFFCGKKESPESNGHPVNSVPQRTWERAQAHPVGSGAGSLLVPVSAGWFC